LTEREQEKFPKLCCRASLSDNAIFCEIGYDTAERHEDKQDLHDERFQRRIEKGQHTKE
jgi:hypothetical protein